MRIQSWYPRVLVDFSDPEMVHVHRLWMIMAKNCPHSPERLTPKTIQRSHRGRGVFGLGFDAYLQLPTCVANLVWLTAALLGTFHRTLMLEELLVASCY